MAIARTSSPRASASSVRAISALPAVARIVKTIAVYDNFCHANDPYEEHDFGSFEADGYVIFFKIDYYSPDAADQSVTERVITICLLYTSRCV